MNTPQVGDVWGCTSKPETWRYVTQLCDYEVWFRMFGGNGFWKVTIEHWEHWREHENAINITAALAEREGVVVEPNDARLAIQALLKAAHDNPLTDDARNTESFRAAARLEAAMKGGAE